MWIPLVGALALAAPPTTVAPPTTSAPASAAPTPAATASGATTFSPISDKTYVDTVLKPRAGRVVLVNFWAGYCLPCLEEMPALVKLQAQFKDDVDVVFVSTDDPAQISSAGKVLAKRKIAVASSFFVDNVDPDPFIAAVDPAWLGAIPHTIVYGRDGTILRKLAGAQSAASFEEALRLVIAASPPAPATTPATTKKKDP